MSFGLHHGIREVTGYDRYFTVQDTHGCSFSHSAVSFSIACEMVALGPALHGLRHGATCYSLFVFHFVLQSCHLQWFSHVPCSHLPCEPNPRVTDRQGTGSLIHILWLHSVSSFSMLCRLCALTRCRTRLTRIGSPTSPYETVKASVRSCLVLFALFVS